VRIGETPEMDRRIFSGTMFIPELSIAKSILGVNCSSTPKKFSLKLGFSATFSEKRSQPPLETFLIFFKEQI
jgi:hypothetical protein